MYNSKQENVSGIQIVCAQFLALQLRKVMLNASNIYHLEFTHQMQIYIQVFSSFTKIQESGLKNAT